MTSATTDQLSQALLAAADSDEYERAVAASLAIAEMYRLSEKLVKRAVAGYRSYREYTMEYGLSLATGEIPYIPAIEEVMDKLHAVWVRVFEQVDDAVRVIAEYGKPGPECEEAKQIRGELLSIELADSSDELPEHLEEAAHAALEEYNRIVGRDLK